MSVDVEPVVQALCDVLDAEFSAQGWTVYRHGEDSYNTPAIVPMPGTGSMDWAAARLAKTEHRVSVAFLQNRFSGGSLYTADEATRPLIARFIRLLAAHFTLGGTIERWGNLTYRYGGIDFSGNDQIEYLGVIFEVDFRAREALDVRP